MGDVGARLRDDAKAWQDAVEVAHETMRRVRQNVERLHEALSAEGYRFASGDRALVAPAAGVREQLDDVERVMGPIPLAVRVWLEEVGGVNLSGTHPAWQFDYTDAFVVQLEYPIDEIVEEYEDRRATGWFTLAKTDRFPLSLAPDYLHKADVSGSAPYAVGVPDAGVDAPWLRDDLHRCSFVEYLRIALLQWGGFPGWARREPDWASPTEPWPRSLAELAAGFERF
jgi:hypothetical protein